MKKILFASVSFIIMMTFISCQKGDQAASVLKTHEDSLSYSIGLTIGKNLQQDSVVINPELFARAMKDLAANKPLLSDTTMRTVIAEYGKRRIAEKGEKNKKAGEAFLEENKKKTGVVVLPSGMQYRVITMGDGKKPKATQMVLVHYRGMNIDGVEFDSSFRNGQPVSFRLNQVIKGWTEALQLMPVGSKWELFIPSDLAYGQNGISQAIGPNSTLIFEIELLGVK